MFRMKVIAQTNVLDRTLIAGVAEEFIIPKIIYVDNKSFRVVGVPTCAKFPHMGLEIEKTDYNFECKTVTDKNIIIKE